MVYYRWFRVFLLCLSVYLQPGLGESRDGIKLVSGMLSAWLRLVVPVKLELGLSVFLRLKRPVRLSRG